MSERQEKKMRREIRKQYGAKLLELAQEKVKYIKNKPRWVPMWLWSQVLSIFIKKTL